MIEGTMRTTRRDMLRRLGVGTAVLPFLGNLPSLAVAATSGPRRRLVIVFSPDGTVKKNFWPAEPGPFTSRPPVVRPLPLPPILEPFEPFRDRLLTLQGINNRITGDGDGHMRGIGCLLTGIELLPGNGYLASDGQAGR